MSDSIKIALAQINTTVGNIAGNSAAVVDWTRKAQGEGADLVLFPEMTLTGYPIEDLALRSSLQEASVTALHSLASELAVEGLGDVTVVVGYLDTGNEGLPTNSAAVIRNGVVEGTYAKHHLPNYGVFDEHRLFTPGNDTLTVDVNGTKVGIAICEDIWQKGGTVSALANENIDVLAVINGSPFEVGKRYIRTKIAAKRAAELGVPVAYVNLVGGQDDLVFDGGSFFMNADGERVTQSPAFVEDLLLWTVGTDDFTPSTYINSNSDGEVYGALVLGLGDYVRKNGFKSVVLGVSGGIDSALVAAIAADAIGGENVYGISMPSAYSSEHSKDDAQDLCERIGAHYSVQSIAPMFDAFQSNLALDGVAEENLQARIRGVILMAASNSDGHLVLATGNKSELAVGYSTIYGDAVGGYAPLKDVPKTRAWAISRWRNETAEAKGEIAPIPWNSITKPPSAELRPGQVDQDSLPDYDLLDAILHDYIEAGIGREGLLERHPEAAVTRVLSLVDKAEWKRRQYPPGIKVTSLAFGRDRRVPITHAWREGV